MSAETQQIIAEVEDVSGLPVQVVAVADLGVIARITTSPHVTGSYVVQYRPGISFKDYMDAVMYCLGALQTFAKMPKEDVRKVTFEIALLGTKGLDVNDPDLKFQLRSLPGRFSGLHLVSIEYVGFKLLDPSVDIGFDLSQEYRQAQLLFGDGSEATS